MKQRIMHNIDRMKESYIFLYSLFFVIIFLLGFKEFIFDYGKSFICTTDGISQHFPFLYDWAETVKEIIRDPQGGVPLWSWQIGLGADTIHSYSYYVLGDPLSNLIALIFPLSKIELGYNIMVVVRVFLTGISLLCYCKYMGLKQLPSVIGSLIFAFSGHILFWGIRHPFFINAGIILPWLFISIEEILKRKKPYWFILCVTFSAINSFYFFYMNSIAIFIYSVIRFFFYVEENRTKVFVKTFVRVSCYYILGVAIGSVFFIPAIYGFLNTYRVPENLKPDLSFNLLKIIKMFIRFVIIDYEKRILRVSVAAISFPIILLFLGFKGRVAKSYKILFVTFTILLCLPFMHSVFNGFSAPNDRWVYIYICIICFIVAYSLNNIEEISKKNEALWALLAFEYLGIFEFDITVFNLLLVTAGTYCFLVCFITNNSNSLKNKARRIDENLLQIGILLLVTVNLITNISALMSQKNYGVEFADYNSVLLDKYKHDKTATLPTIQKDEFYRVEYDDKSNNRSVVNNFSGAYLYNSIIDKDIIKFYNYYKLRTRLATSAYSGFDGISALNSLMDVKYYVVNKDEKNSIPYGFKKRTTDGEVITYENKNQLSLGFVYYDYFLKKDLSRLSNVDRIYAMMDSAVVDGNVEGINKKSIPRSSKEIEYEVVGSDGVKFVDDKVIVSKQNGRITLQVKNVLGNELFLLINRIYYQDENENFKVTVETNKVKKNIETRSVQNTYYTDNRDYLYNLGYAGEDEVQIKVKFSLKGDYDFDKLTFLAMDMKNFNKKVEKLNNSKLREMKYGTNFVSGKVSLHQKGILFLSIPHSPGWRAYVDGKEVETMKVNIAFTGIVVDEGDHELLLKYRTPYIVPSILLSLCGVFVLILIIYFDKKSIRT